MHNMSAPFIFQEECRMKIEYDLFLFVFSKLRIRVSEGHFYCVHTIRFSEPTKIGSLKSDHENMPFFIKGCPTYANVARQHLKLGYLSNLLKVLRKHIYCTVESEVITPREYLSALDFKDAAAPRFDHIDVVFSIFINEHQKIPSVNCQQKCLINGICSTFDIKPNYFGPVIPKKLSKFWKIG